MPIVLAGIIAVIEGCRGSLFDHGCQYIKKIKGAVIFWCADLRLRKKIAILKAMKDASFALNILDTIVYATIATAAVDGSPWAAPQFIAYNRRARQMYWCASRNSQHARNLEANPRAFITVYDSSVGPGEGNGVYLETRAEEITDPIEQARAMEQLIERHGSVPYWTLENIQAADSPIGVFKASIERAWVNEDRQEHGQFVLYRKAIEL